MALTKLQSARLYSIALGGARSPIRLAQAVIQPQGVSELRGYLNRHLEMVTIRAEQFSKKTAQLTALDCQYTELLPEQFISIKVERQVRGKVRWNADREM